MKSGLMRDKWQARRAGWRRDDHTDRQLRKVTRAEIPLRAPAPRTDKCKVERAADNGTRDGDQTADPLFRGFFAEFYGEAFGDARRQFFQHLFFSQVLAEVNSGRRRGCQPKVTPLVVALRFKSIEQSQTLDQSQRNDC